MKKTHFLPVALFFVVVPALGVVADTYFHGSSGMFW
jgi:hypothetical protein